MKKTMILFLACMLTLLLAPRQVWGDTGSGDRENQNFLTLSAGAGGKFMSDSTFRDVYGSVIPAWQMGLGIFLWENLELFLQTDFFSKEGEETFSKEDTSVRVFPVELGTTYFLSGKRLQPFISLGCGYYIFKEESSMGEASSQTFGVLAQLGARYHIKEKLIIDIKGKYSQFKTDADAPEESNIQLKNKSVQGFSLLVSIGIIL